MRRAGNGERNDALSPARTRRGAAEQCVRIIPTTQRDDPRFSLAEKGASHKACQGCRAETQARPALTPPGEFPAVRNFAVSFVEKISNLGQEEFVLEIDRVVEIGTQAIFL